MIPRSGFSKLLAVVVIALLCDYAVADSSLWVEKPEGIAYTVAGMSAHASELGLSGQSLAHALERALSDAGLAARRADFDRDDRILFLDIIVKPGSFYASLQFWRKASYVLPNGEQASEFVPVWEGFSLGDHHNKPGAVRSTVNKIVGNFIAEYRDANSLDDSSRVASSLSD